MENTWSNSLLLMVVLLAHGAALGAVALLQQDAPVPDELPSISGVLIQAPPAKTVQAPPAVREPVQQQSVQKTPQTLQPLTQRPKQSAETPKLTKPVPEQAEAPAPKPKPVPQVTESTPRPAPATTDPYEGTPVTAPNTRQHRNPDPRYPSLSRRRGEEGTVILELLVLKDGSVENVTIKESSGFPRLDKSAMEAVRRWKYNPAKRGGQAIDYRYLQPVTFSLQG